MDAALDLGVLSGPVLVFGGPYSNLQATIALKAETERRAIAPQNCLCTGDIAAYCADPQGTLTLIRDWGVHVVMGNCEYALASGAQHCGCGFEESSACNALSKQWFAYATAHLDAQSCEWMGSRPKKIRFELAHRRIVAVHGGVAQLNRFIFASSSQKEKRDQADSANADVILAGHSGLPFTQVLENGALWHNAGVIGMPANDGTSDVWYSILAPSQDERNLKITHHRLVYDHRSAAQRMRAKGLGAKGLGEDYAGALESGYWPSLDVLPEKERALTGIRLNPGSE